MAETGEEMRKDIVEAAMNGVDIDLSSIDVLMDVLLATEKKTKSDFTETHVLWYRRELCKLFRREVSLKLREDAVSAREARLH